jgi:hypothetical protein
MDDFKDKIINWFVQTFAAKAVVKALSAAAVLLAAHGIFKHTDSTAWVNSNAEVITGALGWALTWLLTRKQHTGKEAATNAAVVTALNTDTPAPADMAATAKAIIEQPTPNGL